MPLTQGKVSHKRRYDLAVQHQSRVSFAAANCAVVAPFQKSSPKHGAHSTQAFFESVPHNAFPDPFNCRNLCSFVLAWDSPRTTIQEKPIQWSTNASVSLVVLLGRSVAGFSLTFATCWVDCPLWWLQTPQVSKKERSTSSRALKKSSPMIILLHE